MVGVIFSGLKTRGLILRSLTFSCLASRRLTDGFTFRIYVQGSYNQGSYFQRYYIQLSYIQGSYIKRS